MPWARAPIPRNRPLARDDETSWRSVAESFPFAEHSARLVASIDRTLVANELPPLDPRLRAAIVGVPRHLFFHRYTLEEGGPVQAIGPTPEQLALVYSDRGFGHVAPDGSALPSTNSVPSFMMRLLASLDLQAGQRVLEIGSGSGWLVALMSRLVAPHGHAVGIEIIESLAAESRTSLAAAGIGDVEIHHADGGDGHVELAPYDRIIVTASTYDVPRAWREQLRDGGRIVVPLADPSGARCDVVLLARDGDALVKRGAVVGDFVPFTGVAARENPRVLALADVAGWSKAPRPCTRHALRFGAGTRHEHGFATIGFCRFLARRDPRYIVAAKSDDHHARWFGLASPDGTSIAVCDPHGLTGYGTPDTTHALLEHYALWCRLGMPTPDAFDLRVTSSAITTPPDDRTWCADPRGDATLWWSLRDDVVPLPLPLP
jgi:protein-L-isoaspartate(D-aspartate) O-methyltransferase